MFFPAFIALFIWCILAGIIVSAYTIYIHIYICARWRCTYNHVYRSIHIYNITTKAIGCDYIELVVYVCIL